MDKLAAYLDQIGAVFPDLAGAPARLNPEGLTNEVVIVDERYVFRFPKNDESRAAMAREAEVLDLVARHVSLPVPRYEHRDERFVMYRLVPGRPLYRHELLRHTEAVQEQVAAQLATFLAELHATPLDTLPAEVPSGGRTRGWLERQEVIEREIGPLLWSDQRAWIADLFAPVQSGELDLDAFTPVLRHNDLASYHILWQPATAKLTGVIDFGVAGPGDPADDLASLLNTYGESFLRRLHRHTPITQPTLERARFLAASIELSWLLNGLRENDRSWFAVHLGRARDALPFGEVW